jgi:pimeloyl-ACP methyl ester carboxylesterase
MVAVVLLPGMDGTGALFADFVSALDRGLRPIIVSYPKDRPLSYAELEGVVRPQLPAGGPYILLAESFSGPLAIALAAAQPPGLAGLVLCCSFARNPRPLLTPLARLADLLPLREKYLDWLMPFLFGRQASATLRSAVKWALRRVSPEVLKTRLRDVLAVDMTRQLPQVRVPVLYLRATRDRIVPPAAMRRIAGGVPLVQTIAIDAPHMLLQTRPHEAATIVHQFAEGTVAAFDALRHAQPAPASMRA